MVAMVTMAPFTVRIRFLSMVWMCWKITRLISSSTPRIASSEATWARVGLSTRASMYSGSSVLATLSTNMPPGLIAADTSSAITPKIRDTPATLVLRSSLDDELVMAHVTRLIHSQFNAGRNVSRGALHFNLPPHVTFPLDGARLVPAPY